LIKLCTATNIKILLFYRNILQKKEKCPSVKAKGLEIVLAPQTERLSQLLYEGGDGKSLS